MTSPVRATYLKWLIGDSLIQRYLHWLSSSICAVLTSCTKYHVSCDAKPLEKIYLQVRETFIPKFFDFYPKNVMQNYFQAEKTIEVGISVSQRYRLW